MKIPSTFPLSTTLVSPVTILTPAFSEVSLIDFTIFLKSFIKNPSSIIKLKLKNLGIEKLVTKSFTVPQTASFPISPPLKNNGFTTKEFVVKDI